jgi:membrane protease YdiL (CAAX protease family)
MMEPWSAVLLMLTCFWAPLMAIGSARRLGGGPLPFSRRRLFIQTTFIQAVLFGVAFMASRQTKVPLLLGPPATLTPWLLAAALVIAGVALLRWRWAERGGKSKYRLYSILPRTARDFPPYLVLCLAAGIGEEAAYRGMLVSILWWLTGRLLVAVLISAAVFGLAHAVQGVRGVVTIFIIALIAHALVYLGKSLLPVMAAHTLYDAIAGWLIPRWYERDAALRSTSELVVSSGETGSVELNVEP